MPFLVAARAAVTAYVGYVSRGCCSRTTGVVFTITNYTIRESTREESADAVFGVCCAPLLSESSISLARYNRKRRSAQPPAR